MGENTKIEWTDHTFNPWIGCARVHTGCVHCYAEALAKRTGLATWGSSGTRTLTTPDYWKGPRRWNRQAEKAGERRRVFCASMADVFEDWAGELRAADGSIYHQCRAGYRQGLESVYVNGAECGCGCGGLLFPMTMETVRRNLFALIDATPWLDWLLVTKRPENVPRFWPSPMPCGGTRWGFDHYRANVWIGTSVSDQETADVMIARLFKSRALSPVLFLSAEPLVGPVDLHNAFFRPRRGVDDTYKRRDLLGVDWVIAGGESGPGARPCDVAWIRSIVEQCKAAAVPVFVKQLGARPELHERKSAAELLFPEGVPAGVDVSGFADRHLTNFLDDAKGGDPSEWPVDLRVREYPQPGSIVAK